MASEHVVAVTTANFDQEVLKAGTPVLVDFWATWCGPCKMIAPILDELAGEKTGKIKIAKVDVDSNQDLASKYGIRAIPTLLLFKDGTVKEQMVGMVGKKDLEKRLGAYLA